MRRLTIKAPWRLAQLLLVAFAGSTALAQQELIDNLLSVDAWVLQMQTYMTSYQDQFLVVGGALAGLGLVVRLISVALSGHLLKLNQEILTFLVAAGLIAATTLFSTFFVELWSNINDQSVEVMTDVFQDAEDDFRLIGEASSRVLSFVGLMGLGPSAGAVAGAVKAGGKAVVSSGIGAQAGGRIFGAAMTYLNISLIPVIFYALTAHMVSLGAGLVVFMACAFLPIAFGSLVFGGSGAMGMFSSTVGALVSALVVSIFAPLIFAGVFVLTISNPVSVVAADLSLIQQKLPNDTNMPAEVTQYQNQVDTYAAEIEAAQDAAYSPNATEADKNRLAELWGNFVKWDRRVSAAIMNWRETAYNAVAEYFSTLWQSIIFLLLSTALMFIATLMGHVLLMLGARQAGAFVGGIALHGFQALSSTAAGTMGGLNSKRSSGGGGGGIGPSGVGLAPGAPSRSETQTFITVRENSSVSSTAGPSRTGGRGHPNDFG